LLDDAGFVDATAVRMLLGVVYLYAATRGRESVTTRADYNRLGVS
jgi:hypothetical protein